MFKTKKSDYLSFFDAIYNNSSIQMDRKYNEYKKHKNNAVLGQQTQKTKNDNGGIKLETPPQSENKKIVGQSEPKVERNSFFK